MNSQLKELQQGIENGFINKDAGENNLFKPELLVNNNKDKKVVSTIQEQLISCDNFYFSIAFITTSGLACLKQELLDLAEKNIKGRILTSQYLNFTQPEALRQLLELKNIELRIAINSNLHAKGYMFSQQHINNIIIGSSNCTANALTSNKEWNLKISCSKNGAISNQVEAEFLSEFQESQPVSPSYIEKYQLIYNEKRKLAQTTDNQLNITPVDIKPNAMQQRALNSLNKLRIIGKTKALIISATGTGKTYLSAFDVLKVKPQRMLFVVHRANIAKAAMQSYQKIFQDKNKSCGLYSGKSQELNKDFVFTTVQTISRDSHLNKFSKNDFDYIVIDETHRASASSYQKVLSYFQPKFLLGMTATPNRTDRNDIFKVFDHNIAYVINLQDALEMDLLSPFHYYGVTDIELNGALIEEKSTLNNFDLEIRVQHILRKIKQYGTDNGVLRGLIFCASIKECEELSEKFNENGYKTAVLTGKQSNEQRDFIIEKLESDNLAEKIDYIFSVDILNEGVDIPKVNQIVMLRPTQSAIVFVQQLGRGLRKANNKDYLTVIDFIGNYKNNFLVPVALFGDNSYNKDSLRKLIYKRSVCLSGSSTISFDKVAKEQIYQAINLANLQTKKALKSDFDLLKYRIGRAPLMMDFIENDSRDPFAYVQYSKSLFSFAKEFEDSLLKSLDDKEEKLIQVFSSEINNGKRVGESYILDKLLKSDGLSLVDLKNSYSQDYGYELSEATIFSLINNLNLNFIREKNNGSLKTIAQIYGFKIVNIKEKNISWEPSFALYLQNPVFKRYLQDSVQYSIYIYNKNFNIKEYFSGFQLYRKYSRKDVFRILNWQENPVAQNVGGYIIDKEKNHCPIFVNYHKKENISDTTKYNDYFINDSEFSWMSKSKRTLKSSDVQTLKNHNNKLRIPFFIKKSDDEGSEFYYMGDVVPQDASFVQTNMPTAKGSVNVVNLRFNLKVAVKPDLYKYLIEK